MEKVFKNFSKFFYVILSLIGYFTSPQAVFADISVAGCSSASERCIIDPDFFPGFPSSPLGIIRLTPHSSLVIAPVQTVWSSEEAWGHMNHTRGMIGDTESRLNVRVDQVTTRINEVRNEITNDINRRVIEINNRTDNEIRNSLRNELQNLLRAQTCENHVVPNEGIGTPERIQALTAKFNCIQTSLDNWRGVNPQGQVVGIVDNSALSRAQIVQLLRSLELLFNDPDLTADQLQYIGQVQNHFIHFNMD